jgi:hypothetical protein
MNLEFTLATPCQDYTIPPYRVRGGFPSRATPVTHADLVKSCLFNPTKASEIGFERS